MLSCENCSLDFLSTVSHQWSYTGLPEGCTLNNTPRWNVEKPHTLTSVGKVRLTDQHYIFRWWEGFGLTGRTPLKQHEIMQTSQNLPDLWTTAPQWDPHSQSVIDAKTWGNRWIPCLFCTKICSDLVYVMKLYRLCSQSVFLFKKIKMYKKQPNVPIQKFQTFLNVAAKTVRFYGSVSKQKGWF